MDQSDTLMVATVEGVSDVHRVPVESEELGPMVDIEMVMKPVVVRTGWYERTEQVRVIRSVRRG